MLGTSTSQIYKKVKMEISKCAEKQRTGKDIVYINEHSAARLSMLR